MTVNMTWKLFLNCNLNIAKSVSGKLMLESWGKVSKFLKFLFKFTFLSAENRFGLVLKLSLSLWPKCGKAMTVRQDMPQETWRRAVPFEKQEYPVVFFPVEAWDKTCAYLITTPQTYAIGMCLLVWESQLNSTEESLGGP